jgi:hypothetical protein
MDADLDKLKVEVLPDGTQQPPRPPMTPGTPGQPPLSMPGPQMPPHGPRLATPLSTS